MLIAVVCGMEYRFSYSWNCSHAITVFYFIILIFQINITSGSITCYIMYSQLLIIAYDCIIAGDIYDIADIFLMASTNSKLFVKSPSMTSGIFVSFATSSHHFASVAG